MGAVVPKHLAIVISEKLCAQLAAVTREVREQRALSQNKVAATADLSCQMIGYVEKQTRTPSIDVYARIAFGLGVKLSDLVAEAERRVGIK